MNLMATMIACRCPPNGRRRMAWRTGAGATGIVGRSISVQAGVETAVITLWLGHADIRSTNA